MEFGTFAANSPAYSPTYPSPSPKHKPSIQLSPSPYIHHQQNYQIHDPTIGSLQTYLPSRQGNSRRSNGFTFDEEQLAQRMREQYQRRQSMISRSLSQVSVPLQKRRVQPGRLTLLEGQIMQQILQLREQKITLMEQLNKQIDIRHLYQEELQRLERTRVTVTNIENSPSSQDRDIQYVPEDLSVEALRKNDQLRIKLKEVNIKREIFGQGQKQGQTQQQLINEIIKYRQMNHQLEHQCQKLANLPQESQSRFITFLPSDKNKHFGQTQNRGQLQPSPSAILYNSLLNQYNQLLEELESRNPPALRQSDLEYLDSLRAENQQLITEVEQMLVRKAGRQGEELEHYRRKAEENQREKELFLQDFQAFKFNLMEAKQQNTRLKNQIQ